MAKVPTDFKENLKRHMLQKYKSSSTSSSSDSSGGSSFFDKLKSTVWLCFVLTVVFLVLSFPTTWKIMSSFYSSDTIDVDCLKNVLTWKVLTTSSLVFFVLSAILVMNYV